MWLVPLPYRKRSDLFLLTVVSIQYSQNVDVFFVLKHVKYLIFVSKGEDTMTGDGGEYLRAEDLRELGDDSLPGHYLDGFNYMSHNLDRSKLLHAIIKLYKV